MEKHQGSHTIFAEFANSANKYADKTAFKQIINGKLVTTSYSMLMANIHQFQSVLAQLSLYPGACVGLLATSSPMWATAYLACLSMNLTVACLDPGLHSEQIDALMKEANVKVLLTDNAAFKILTIEDFRDLPILNIENQLSAFNMPSPLIPPIAAAGADHTIASILFTSGTSGDFKGVLLEHSAILHSIRTAIETTSSTPEDNILSLLPAHHIYALVCVILCPLMSGSSITFIEKLDGEHILQAMELGKPSIIIGVPRIYELLGTNILATINKKPFLVASIIKLLLKFCLHLRKLTGINLGKHLFASVHKKFGGNIRLLISGAASLQNTIYYLLFGLGFTVLEGYGLTETSASITLNPFHKQKAGSVGQTMNGVKIKLMGMDAQGVGEICVQSPSLMKGYLNNPSATTNVIKNHWYHTGDLGSFDKDGYLFITGRIKEIIVLASGKKVPPSALENYLLGMPDVLDFAVVGVSSPSEPGENIHLALVLDPKALDAYGIERCEKMIQDTVDKRLSKAPSWYHLHRIHFLDKIPRTNTLKVKRSVLAQKLASVSPINAATDKKVSRSAANENNVIQKELITIISTLLPYSSKIVINGESSFQYDLGLDSISMNELLQKTQDTFDIKISSDKLPALFRVKDLVNLVTSEIENKVPAVDKNKITSQTEQAEIDLIDKNFNDYTKLTGWKLALHNKIYPFSRYLFENYFHYSYSGLENIDKNKNYIVSANHTSHLDNLSLAIALNNAGLDPVAAAAKDYFFDRKIVHFCMSSILKMIPFDRNYDNAALQRNLQYAKLCKENHFSILIFPEGTRSLNGEVGSFKNGAALFSDLLNIEILPAYISGTYECLPKGSFFPKRGAIHVKFGKPLKITDYFSSTDPKPSLKDYHNFMEHLRTQILSMKDSTIHENE